MKNQLIFALLLFLLLTTITSQKKIIFKHFDLKEIIIKNNFLVEEKDIKKLLISIYGKNLIFIDNQEIEKALTQISFIDTFNIKKIYPDKLKIEIFEKKPIAVLFNKKKKFYLSEKIELIEFIDLKNYQNLPYVFGNKDEFKILYNNLKKIDFPFHLIKKYTLYSSRRWDLETINNKIIKLPPKDYIKNINNYLNLIKKKDFRKYKVFDYRINNQLILK
jgi:cell division protein FtsQ